MTVAIIFFYLLGFLNGMIALFFVTIWMGKRMLDKQKKGDTAGRQSAVARMKRVKEIAGEMLELAMKTQEPQRNGLDGKYKNSLNSRINALDEEKNEILKSLLKDGHDLELTTVDGAGVVTKMKLSEYMAHMGITVEPKKSQSDIKTERMGKFTVFRGGKDDDEDDGEDDGGMTH